MSRQILIALLLTSCAALACSETGPKESEIAPDEVAEGAPLKAESNLGPVSAIVTLSPSSPLIGDVMDLSLEVSVEEGVRVEMPRFQEALSRFSIEGYSNEALPEASGTRYVQRYRLHASTSGHLRVPPLRVVFFDERPESEQGGEEQELLTEEIAIKIRPVLSGDEASDAQLRPIRRTLEEELGPSLWRRYWWAFIGGGALAALIGALFFVRRGRVEPTISPYERASVALAQLESRGLPDEEMRDDWYVQLSGIVRRYLEDRFGLRSPELTTEEFLRVAQRSDLVSDEHKKLLLQFLADCDRVKFAGYEPGEEESQGVLEAARRFLLETRVDVLASSTAASEENAA
ncbi:MAG: hypothetical protein GY811_06685 [Myxococcales bacterium]|nr:hypothetical protein [Myxococcales bacterium]